MADSAQTTILVTEPDSTFRKALTRALLLEDYKISEATTFEQMVHNLECSAVQLIITDVHIPHVDGITLLRWLHRTYPDIPVIILTRSATISTAIEAVKLGVADYLLKPLSTKSVLTAITHALNEKLEHIQRERLAESVFDAFESADVSASSWTNTEPVKQDILYVAPITLDTTAHLLYADDRPAAPVALSAREAALLEAMMRHPNDILTFQDLAGAIGAGDTVPESDEHAQKVIRPCVSRLRKKIETHLHHRVIFTIRRTGYLYRPASGEQRYHSEK